MDIFEWFIYWLVVIPLAVGVLFFGAIALTFVALIWWWQWLFSEARWQPSSD